MLGFKKTHLWPDRFIRERKEIDKEVRRRSQTVFQAETIPNLRLVQTTPHEIMAGEAISID